MLYCPSCSRWASSGRPSSRSCAARPGEIAEPEGPGFTDVVRDNLLPGLTGLGVTVGVFLPALVRAWTLLPSASSGEVLARVTHPVETLGAPVFWAEPLFWGLAVVGLLWLPWALLVAAMTRSVFTALNPLRALACIRAVGRDARVVTGVFLLLALVHAGLHVAAQAVLELPILLVPRLLAEALTCLAPFAAANLLGLVLYVHGDALGYLPARDYLEPTLGDTAPLHAPSPCASPPSPKPRARTKQRPAHRWRSSPRRWRRATWRRRWRCIACFTFCRA